MALGKELGQELGEASDMALGKELEKAWDSALGKELGGASDLVWGPSHTKHLYASPLSPN